MCALDDSYGLASLYIAQVLEFTNEEMDAIRYHPMQPMCSAAFLLDKLSTGNCTISELRGSFVRLGNEAGVRILDDVLAERSNNHQRGNVSDDPGNVFNLQDISDELPDDERDDVSAAASASAPDIDDQDPPEYLSDLYKGELMRLCEPLCTDTTRGWKAVAHHLQKHHIVKEIEAPRSKRLHHKVRYAKNCMDREDSSGAYSFIDLLSVRYDTIISLRDDVQEMCREQKLDRYAEVIHVMQAFQQCFDAKVQIKLSSAQLPNSLRQAFLTDRTMMAKTTD